MRIAAVGAGGKTTLLKRLAEQYRKQGKKVLLTTSTHMAMEPDVFPYTGRKDFLEQALQRLEQGFLFTGSEQGKKISALPKDLLEELLKNADVLLMEADGSRRLPVKVCREDEPVLPMAFDKIYICVGLNGLFQPAGQAVHRYALAGLKADELLEPVLLQKIVRRNYLERLQGKKVEIMPTHITCLYDQVIARFFKEDKDVSLIDAAWFQPAPVLFLCGAGHVGKQTAILARQLGFTVTIADDRQEFLDDPAYAECTRLCLDFKDLQAHLIDGAYYVIVTRGHEADYDCALAILQSPFAYAGMIGSRKKVPVLRKRLLEAGIRPEILEQLHAPIGLAIHATTPAEIAVSILAQIIDVKNTRPSSSASADLLKMKKNGVLAILLKKSGSSPRNEGSMMFVSKEGTIDSIGGGLLEAAVIQDARTVTSICTKEYVFDNSEAANLGMICGGRNTVLFVPIEEEAAA